MSTCFGTVEPDSDYEPEIDLCSSDEEMWSHNESSDNSSDSAVDNIRSIIYWSTLTQVSLLLTQGEGLGLLKITENNMGVIYNKLRLRMNSLIAVSTLLLTVIIITAFHSHGSIGHE